MFMVAAPQVSGDFKGKPEKRVSLVVNSAEAFSMVLSRVAWRTASVVVESVAPNVGRSCARVKVRPSLQRRCIHTKGKTGEFYVSKMSKLYTNL